MLWLLLGKSKKNFPLLATSNLFFIDAIWIFVLHAHPEANCSVSLSFLQAFPSQLDDRLVCNGLSHFLKWFHRYFCRRNEGFSALLWVVWHHWNQMIFFNKKHLTTIIASVTRDVRNKAYLTTALSLEYIIPVSCFSDSTFLSAVLLITFWQTSLKSKLEGALWLILSQQYL